MTEKINIRETFLPDEGCVFVRIDLSQIEDRMCKMYCGTERMIELANRKPEVYDAHTENAQLIFGKQNIDKQERYLGKKCVHASQRKMQGLRMSESVSKDTDGEVFIPPRQCDALIRKYLDAMHEIEDIYFPWVEAQVRNVGMLYDSWGGRFDIRDRRVDDELYRECYSWYLQVEAARWTNQYGFIPASHWMQAMYQKPLNAQVHDEVMASLPLLGTYEYAKFVVKSFEQRREIPTGSGNWLCVPATVTVGRSYGDKKATEFKKLPHKDDFFHKLAEGGFFDDTR